MPMENHLNSRKRGLRGHSVERVSHGKSRVVAGAPPQFPSGEGARRCGPRSGVQNKGGWAPRPQHPPSASSRAASSQFGPGSPSPVAGVARASATARRGARRQQLQVTVSGGAPPPRPPRASATAGRGARRQQLQVTVSGGAPPPRPPGPLLPLRLLSWKLREPRARAPSPKPVAERGKSAFGKTRSSHRHACGPGGISRTGHSPRSQTTNFPSLRAKGSVGCTGIMSFKDHQVERPWQGPWTQVERRGANVFPSPC
ncbi:synapsin-1 [Macaca nemestrina]|uniref:synapsin-1 n=1 Tax=Macaca nemestrina TaxID=9545 RepID=UPI0039B93BF9